MIPTYSNTVNATSIDAEARGPTSAFSGGGSVGKEKSVRFSDKATAPLDRPASSLSLTPLEKRGLWYTRDDYDRCKREAASDAGVGIMCCDSDKRDGGDPTYVTKGNFDGDGAPGEKPRYNENEYKDEFVDGRFVCRRGLGYHFSRGRRNSRAATRSFVLAWQKTLRDPNGDPSLGLGSAGGAPTRAERSRAVLAVVSSRCSRVAREEARWRGDVDYRIAHPERRGAAGKRRGEEVRAGGVARGGDPVDDDDARRKRRRMATAA